MLTEQYLEVRETLACRRKSGGLDHGKSDLYHMLGVLHSTAPDFITNGDRDKY